ncbi:MAG: hypothetical protein RMY34_25305 [Aulosira sp. DedQUE10]|nr:hypothetical protein [Aulosira sp. DedQUE10]
MKNTLLHKVTAVAIGSFFALSGTAFASTYKIGEISHAAKLGNSEILIAQRRIPHRGPLRDVPVFSKSVAVAETALGNAYAAAQSDAITGRGKSALAESIAKATSVLGNATALSGSTAIGDKKAVATSLAEAETVLGDALAIAQSDAVSGPGKPAIAQSIASAKTAVGNATAIATSSAQ